MTGGRLFHITFCHLFIAAFSSYWPHLDEKVVGQLATLSDDQEYVVEGQQTEEQLQKQRELRDQFVSNRHGESLAETEQESAEPSSDASAFFEKSASTEDQSAPGCPSLVLQCDTHEKNHHVEGHHKGGASPDSSFNGNSQYCIRRVKTRDPVPSGKAWDQDVKMLVSMGAAFSIFVFGMVSSFYDRDSVMAKKHVIASCQSVVASAIHHSFLSSTLALTLGLGITGGLLSKSVASQTGLNWKEIQHQQEREDVFKTAHTLPDVCPSVVFMTEAKAMRLAALENTTHRMASEAMVDWCNKMNEPLDGKTLWDQPGVMNQTTACKTIEEVMKEPKKSKWPFKSKKEANELPKAGEMFTCYDLLQMQDEEIRFQAGRTYFGLAKSRAEVHENKKVTTPVSACGETLKTDTPVSTGMGALCGMAHSLTSQEGKTQEMWLEELGHGKNSSLLQQGSEAKDVALSKRIRLMERRLARLKQEKFFPRFKKKTTTKAPKESKEYWQDNDRWKIVFTKEGAEHFNAEGKVMFSEEPEEGRTVYEKYLEAIKQSEGLDLVGLVKKGWARPEKVPWELFATSDRDGVKVKNIEKDRDPLGELPTPADLKKAKKLQGQIASMEKKLEDLKKDRDTHLQSKEGLKAPVVDFQVDDLPDRYESLSMDLLARQGSDAFAVYEEEPDFEMEDEEEEEKNAETEALIEKMKQLEAAKAQAIHNCLAVASCQMLRKDLGLLAGSGKSRGMFYSDSKDKKQFSMVEEVSQRCLSHTLLKGVAGGLQCKVTEDQGQCLPPKHAAK